MLRSGFDCSGDGTHSRLVSRLLPQYATAVFLLALVPTAVSSPAFAAVFGGHVASSFALVLLSTLAAPLLIPLQFSLIGNSAVTPAPMFLFKTLALCIFIPVIAYLFAKKHRAFSGYVYDRNKLIAIVLVAFIIALVIAKQRTLILSDVSALLPMLAINLFCFVSFLLVGWFFVRGGERKQRITYATCSMFNNVALGVSLALLHFPSDVILFVAASEMIWSLLPAIMNFWLRKQGHSD
ncbi:MAG: hypothetical protein EBR02_08725 [Alphaproteobacteria bacterium]|nr:hypothetical protein [Alphaproteobacteria bacterium]